MRTFASLALAASLMASSVALAQDSIVIDLSGISAELASELGVDVSALPATVSLSEEFAADVCGVDLGDLATCVAVNISDDLLTVIQASIGNGNSARAFAPGQQDGPARVSAPGQQDGAARDAAPGQMKKN